MNKKLDPFLTATFKNGSKLPIKTLLRHKNKLLPALAVGNRQGSCDFLPSNCDINISEVGIMSVLYKEALEQHFIPSYYK